MSESLNDHERIRKRKDFLEIFRRGRRYKGKYFNIVFLPNRLDHSRVAVVAGKKIGNAVTRNRIKRRMRALFRRCKPDKDNSLDLILFPKKNAVRVPWNQLQQDYKLALKSISQKTQL
ncbi:ribonuclease P protein component [bacterium]|nr:ribonuclease P protein component [bacterium]